MSLLDHTVPLELPSVTSPSVPIKDLEPPARPATAEVSPAPATPEPPRPKPGAHYPVAALEELDHVLRYLAFRYSYGDVHLREDLLQEMRLSILQCREPHALGFYRQRAEWHAREIARKHRQFRRVMKPLPFRKLYELATLCSKYDPALFDWDTLLDRGS